MTRTEWIEQNIRLVPQVVHQMPHREKDTEELIAEGMIGLIQAVDGYDPDRGIRFSTFASRCIANAARGYYRKRSHLREVPYEEADSYEEESCRNQQWQYFEEEQKKEEKALLVEALKALKSTERYLIDLRFGFSGKEISQSEAAEFLGVSQSTVSRKEKKILEILRKEMENA